MNPIITKQNQTGTLDSYEKGFLFEQYITRLFNEKHFQVKEWRQSKKVEDVSTLVNHGGPDLELVFTGLKKYRFAVECKWQNKFSEGKIMWAEERKIKRYQDFEREMRIPVFVAIGVGGEPSNPEKLFVTPLCNICMYTEVYETDLIPYKRKPANKFFYDTAQLRLF